MQWNGLLETETTFNPIPADSEVTFIKATHMINQMTIATLHNPASQGYQPYIDNADTQDQSGNAG